MSRPTRRAMGALEGEVMAVLWDRGGWLTPRMVLDGLGDGPPVVYATVMTVLRRLWQKGLVERRPEGKAYAYRPVASRDETAAQRMIELLDASHDPQAALTHFLSGLDGPRRRQLRRILER